MKCSDCDSKPDSDSKFCKKCGNELIKEHKHKKTEHPKKSFIRKIPGFRSDTDWKKALAIIGYTFIALFILVIPFANYDSDIETDKQYTEEDIAAEIIQKMNIFRSNSIIKSAPELVSEFSGSTGVQQDALNKKYKGYFTRGCAYVYTVNEKMFSTDIHATMKNTDSFQSAMSWNFMPEYSVYFDSSEKSKLMDYPPDDLLCFYGTFRIYVGSTGHLAVEDAIVITKDQTDAYDRFMKLEDNNEVLYNYLLFTIPFKTGEDREFWVALSDTVKEKNSINY